MKASLCVVAWILLCANPRVLGPSCSPFLLGTHYSYAPDGAQYASTITQQMGESSPDWVETEANPPLPARKALTLAETSLRAMLKDKDVESPERHLEGVSLIPFGGRKWCWDVHYVWYPRGVGLSGTRPDFHVFILMDGTVIRAEKVGRR